MIPAEKKLKPTAFSINELGAPWYDFNLQSIDDPTQEIPDIEKWLEYNCAQGKLTSSYSAGPPFYSIAVSYASVKSLLDAPDDENEPFQEYCAEDFLDFYKEVLYEKAKEKASQPFVSCPPKESGSLHLDSTPTFEKEKTKKEETPMPSIPLSPPSNTSSLLSTLKTSFSTAAKQVGSVVLAEKITDLVLGRLPMKIQKMVKIVPRPVLVFAVSETVYLAAVRFEIPGRDRVRDISKHAVDGSMYDALKLFTKFLEPLFAAIRNLAPEDLRQLIDESNASG